ncbi:MAG: NAD(P)H-hydrate dehydratase [Chitinophagales bacterium]|nr:NAD(P)H-hydrate dehydratase [Bacteroidota bacterium]MCB9042533.1 NAD(P)H-hydrate dehydratase [Chitinophagales bacterium]
MKIFTAEKTRQIDQQTIENQGISSEDLMERAGNACAHWLQTYFSPPESICVFCGVGNNGGDGLVIARLLQQSGYEVSVIVVADIAQASQDFLLNYEKLQKIRTPIFDLNYLKENENLPANTIVIDALLGTGTNRSVEEGAFAEAIQYINRQNALVVSIDVPSGLCVDYNQEQRKGAIVQANITLSIQFPKMSFLFAENDRYVGDWYLIDIGLDAKAIEETEHIAHYLDADFVAKILKQRPKFAHKGNFGHALLIAGSEGKMGAAVLSAKAALSAGLGLLTCLIPQNANIIMQTAVPEAMCKYNSDEEKWTDAPEIDAYHTFGVGPGIGTDATTEWALYKTIEQMMRPAVFDADAINLIAKNKEWLSAIIPHSIFTPHVKEFERLVGKKFADSESRLEKLQNFAQRYEMIVVLKGAYSAVALPDGSVYFNSTGNPGMATAGSGDVLCGIIMGLLAQGYVPSHAAILGVYVHGLAGDIAAKKLSEEAVTASRIIENLGAAFGQIRTI